MKKAICVLFFGFSVLSFSFSESIHFKKAYIMSKYHGEISKIRVFENGKFSDLYCYEYMGKLYGYNGGDDVQVEFIVDEFIDIAIEE